MSKLPERSDKSKRLLNLLARAGHDFAAESLLPMLHMYSFTRDPLLPHRSTDRLWLQRSVSVCLQIEILKRCSQIEESGVIDQKRLPATRGQMLAGRSLPGQTFINNTLQATPVPLGHV